MDGQRNLFRLFIIVTLLLFPTRLLFAIDFPTKPVNFIVPFSPGGTTDTVARIITDRMEKELGVPVIVLNKPGSGGVVGGEFVAKSKPDGYNIFVIGPPPIIRQAIDPAIPIDVLKDFEPISLFCSSQVILVVKGDSKFNTVDDLVDYARKNPGKLSCGTPGIGTIGHFTAEILKANLKITFKNVPFTSDAQSSTALMGGHIDFLSTTWGILSGKVASGDFRALACYGETRLPEAIIDTPFGFLAPAGTPKEIIERLDKATQAATGDPVTNERYKKLGFYVVYKGSADFGKFLKSELEKYINISKAAGISLK
jgi:tripartite-type tricarboxylate transporter receptor subunit TctC